MVCVCVCALLNFFEFENYESGMFKSNTIHFNENDTSYHDLGYIYSSQKFVIGVKTDNLPWTRIFDVCICVYVCVCVFVESNVLE